MYHGEAVAYYTGGHVYKVQTEIKHQCDNKQPYTNVYDTL